MSFAGVSFIGNGRAACSASSITGAVSASGYHLLVVDGYSRTKQDHPNGKGIGSRPFRFGGCNWVIKYYPNGKCPEDADSISVYLNRKDDDSIEKSVMVHFDFSFLGQVEMQDPSSILATKVCDFGRSSSWGIGEFIKRGALEQSKHLKDDGLTIRCDIIIFTKKLSTEDASAAPFITVPPSDMCQNFGDLLKTKEGVDVVFVVSGETFTAHRCVLAARSTVFKKQFFGPMNNVTTASPICIDDMEAKVFKALLRFIYTDSPGIDEEEEEEEVEEEEGEDLVGEEEMGLEEEDDDDGDDGDENYEQDDEEEDEEDGMEMLEGADEEEVLEGKEEGERMEQDNDDHVKDVEEKKLMWQLLLVAADRYNLRRLELICEEKLCAYIDTSMVANFLVLAEKYNCRGLKKACLDFLRSHVNLQKVISGGGLDHLTKAYPFILKEVIAQLVSYV
ncbi:unnamed protein product [Urochloa decumbens]|uniref:Uncharacterized protein n=1 Tax=Urochloa decumbens TaxID=240449 RepID=A0ABC8YFW0_9POAL